MFFHGICVGIALSLRLNMAAMWGGIAIILLLRLIFYKKYKSILLNAVSGSLGVCTGILPVIIYCLNTHSLKPMIQQSLFFNLQYSSKRFFCRKFFSAFYKYQRFLYASWMSYLSDHCNKIRTVFTKLPGNVCCIPAALCIFCFSVRQKLRALL